MSVRVRWASAFLVGGFTHSLVPAMPADQPPSVPPASQGAPGAAQLLGTWRLVAVTNAEGGRVIPSPDYGAHPAGYLMYDATGHVCVQLMNTARPRWKDEDFPTPAEARSAYMGFGGYCGRYTVHRAERYVVPFPEAAIGPNWIGQGFKRTFEVNGDRLELKADGRRGTDGALTTNVITWIRVKSRAG